MLFAIIYQNEQNIKKKNNVLLYIS